MIAAVLRSRWTRGGGILAVVSAAHLTLWGRHDLTPTINVVELEWTLTALVGATYSIDFIRDNALDWRARVEAGANGATRLVVEIMLLIGWLLAGLHTLLFVLGILSMLTPSNPHPTNLVLATATGVVYVVAGQGLVLILAVIRSKRMQLRAFGASTPQLRGALILAFVLAALLAVLVILAYRYTDTNPF